MYHEFYKLRKDPFNVTPDTSFLYLSHKHKEALAHLHYGVLRGRSFAALTGEIGVGKTTVVRKFLRDLKQGYAPTKLKTALVFNPLLTGMELLSAILRDLGVEVKRRSIDGLLHALADFVTAGNETVILTD